jgi:hypothetical protein
MNQGRRPLRRAQPTWLDPHPQLEKLHLAVAHAADRTYVAAPANGIVNFIRNN